MDGAHTHGPQGGGGLVLIAVIAALAIGSGAVTAAISALEVIAVVIACLGAAAILGGIALLVYRARSDRRAQDGRSQVFTAQVVSSDRRPSPSALEASRALPSAIEPARHVHIHLEGADPAAIAALLRNLNGNSDIGKGTQ